MKPRVALLTLAMLAAACGERENERRERAAPEPPAQRAEVPGIETTVAVTEAVRDVVRAAGAVAPAGNPPEVRDARAQLAEAEARQRLTAQQVRRLQALADEVAPRKELETARAEEASAAAAAARARQVLGAFGSEAEGDGLGPGETWVIGQLLQIDVPQVRAGSEVRFVPDALRERSFAGWVDAPPAYVDAETRTAPVRLRVPDPEDRLRPGMTGAIAIDVGPPHQAVVVPAAAVVYDGAQPVVFVEDGEAHWVLRPVRIGLVGDGRIEVAEGLDAGMRVVTTGAASLLSAIRLRAGGLED